MNIHVLDKKLKRALEDPKEAQKRFGKVMSKKIQRRMNALAAADMLADFWPPMSGPERCHVLVGNLEGVFSMDLEHPYRLLFKRYVPADDGADEPTDEKQRWLSIRDVVIIEIRDTHD